VSRLEEDKSLQTRYESLKQENHLLNNRIHELEEKLQDLSERSEEAKLAAKHKVEDLQREHDLEMQVCCVHVFTFFYCDNLLNSK